MKTRKSTSLELKICKKLTKDKKTLALAESCTGGMISSRLTDTSGSSDYFLGGIVAYSNSAKASILGVSPVLIKKHGAVSQEVAQAMAKGARRVFKSNISLAITGIAGPTGGTKKKPVGLAYIAFDSGKTKKVIKVNFKGSRLSLKKKFSQAALKLILENI